ncbi:MAG: hypothetical protein ACJ8ED_00735 [Xanthobacteraceae bacterium]
MEKDIFAHVRTFEWDNDKRRANLRDHGIDFEDARVVIDGPTIVRRGRKLPDHLGAKSQTR